MKKNQLLLSLTLGVLLTSTAYADSLSCQALQNTCWANVVDNQNLTALSFIGATGGHAKFSYIGGSATTGSYTCQKQSNGNLSVMFDSNTSMAVHINATVTTARGIRVNSGTFNYQNNNYQIPQEILVAILPINYCS